MQTCRRLVPGSQFQHSCDRGTKSVRHPYLHAQHSLADPAGRNQLPDDSCADALSLSLSHSLSHTLAHSCADALSLSLSHSLSHTLAHSLAHTLTYTLAHSFTNATALPSSDPRAYDAGADYTSAVRRAVHRAALGLSDHISSDAADPGPYTPAKLRTDIAYAFPATVGWAERPPFRAAVGNPHSRTELGAFR